MNKASEKNRVDGLEFFAFLRKCLISSKSHFYVSLPSLMILFAPIQVYAQTSAPNSASWFSNISTRARFLAKSMVYDFAFWRASDDFKERLRDMIGPFTVQEEKKIDQLVAQLKKTDRLDMANFSKDLLKQMSDTRSVQQIADLRAKLVGKGWMLPQSQLVEAAQQLDPTSKTLFDANGALDISKMADERYRNPAPLVEEKEKLQAANKASANEGASLKVQNAVASEVELDTNGRPVIEVPESPETETQVASNVAAPTKSTPVTSSVDTIKIESNASVESTSSTSGGEAVATSSVNSPSQTASALTSGGETITLNSDSANADNAQVQRAKDISTQAGISIPNSVTSNSSELQIAKSEQPRFNQFASTSLGSVHGTNSVTSSSPPAGLVSRNPASITPPSQITPSTLTTNTHGIPSISDGRIAHSNSPTVNWPQERSSQLPSVVSGADRISELPGVRPQSQSPLNTPSASPNSRNLPKLSEVEMPAGTTPSFSLSSAGTQTPEKMNPEDLRKELGIPRRINPDCNAVLANLGRL